MKVRLGLRRWAGVLACARKRTHGWRGESGGAVIEFAVTVPVLMTIITGAASFSLAFYNLQQLATATAATVQAVAAESGEPADADPCNNVQTLIQGTGTSTNPGSLPSMLPANLNYQLTITDSTGATHQYPSSGYTAGSGTFSCTAGSSQLASGEPVKLSIKYSYTWLPIPFFSSLTSPLYSTQTAMAD